MAAQGNVLDENGMPILGLHAAGAFIVTIDWVATLCWRVLYMDLWLERRFLSSRG